TLPARDSRGHRRLWRADPSRERVDVERGLFVRVRRPQRVDDLGQAFLREDRLEPYLRDALLSTLLADGRIGALAAEEGAGALGVPRAALVGADPARAGREDRVAHGIERFRRHEDDELPIHAGRPPAADAALTET